MPNRTDARNSKSKVLIKSNQVTLLHIHYLAASLFLQAPNFLANPTPMTTARAAMTYNTGPTTPLLLVDASSRVAKISSVATSG
jgi:hypothetical protein